MSEQLKKHTITIFQHVYNNLPPLVPQDIRQEMEEKLRVAAADGKITVDELEEIMISSAKKVWPFIKAFEDVYSLYESKLADRILKQRASDSIVRKYNSFIEAGGDFKDFYRGALHTHFDHSQRLELSELLVELKKDIRKHAMQAVINEDRSYYEKQIEKYGAMVEEINQVLKSLHRLAHEEEHEGLSCDIHDRARAIEYSLAFLGPQLDHQEIIDSVDYYLGKKQEMKMRRIV